MSKRHTASRRRTYGRRQHELHERLDRRHERSRADRGGRGGHDLDVESLGNLDARGAGTPYGFAD